MRLFSGINPQNSPASLLKTEDEVIILRDRLLQHVLNYSAVLATLTYLFFWINPETRQRIPTLIFFSVVLAVVLIVTLARRIPYNLRAMLAIIIFYCAGVFGLSRGISGTGSIFMLGFIVLSGLLFGQATAFRSGLLALATMVGMGLAVLSGWVVLPDETFYTSNSFSAWVLKALFILAVSSIAFSSASVLLNGLRSLVSQQKTLAKDLEDERAQLAKRIEERTADLEHRLNQIRTAVDITRQIGEMRDPNALIQDIVDLICERFDLYYVGIFLLDERKEFAVLRAGTGDAGRAMLAQNHRLLVGGESMIGWAISHKQARIALDVGQEAVRFNNPHLPYTRSELALPILSRGVVLGAITVQSTQPEAFDDDDIMAFNGIADSLGVALENARLLEETERSLDEIRALNRIYLQQAWTEVIEESGEISHVYTNPSAPLRIGSEHTYRIPLQLRDQVIGQLTLETDADSLSPEDLEFIDAITNQTAVALENARLLAETQQQAASEQKLNELTALFAKSISVDEILKTAVKELGQLPSVGEVAVHLSLPEENRGGNGRSPEVTP